jgi:DNA-binding LacI/PurR family transcriptional regulator
VKVKRATSEDVARLAQVSRTTVSLVVNDVQDVRVSAETRQRILDAARELNYMPNALGRSLVRGKTDTIALVIRNLDLLDVDLYLQPLLFGILTRANRAGFGLRVESLDGRQPSSIANLLDAGSIDGIIVENLNFREQELVQVIERGLPAVIIGSQGSAKEYAVQLDNMAAAAMAMQHLLDLGRRRIVHVPYSPRGVHSTDRRIEGYRIALEQHGIGFDPTLIEPADFSPQSAYDAMQRLLLRTRRDPPDALFAGSDAMAIGAMGAIQDAGFSIPHDIAVIGIDDIGLAASIRPSITTVESHPEVQGGTAAKMLIELINGRKPQRIQTIVPKLIVRGSTLAGFDQARWQERFPDWSR